MAGYDRVMNTRAKWIGLGLLAAASSWGYAWAEETPSPSASPELGVSPGTPSEKLNIESVKIPSRDGLIEIDRIEHKSPDVGSTVFFKQDALAPLKTSLLDLEAVGVLRHPQQRIPYLLLSGASCRNCAVSKMLLLLRADGKFPLTLVYPGRIRDRKNGQVVFEGRAFYGECAPGRMPVYLMFQKEKVDRRRFPQQSAFVAEVQEHGVDERLIVRRMPSLAYALKQVKRKRCFEISGFERQSVKFSIQKVKPEELDAVDENESDAKVDERVQDKKETDPVEADPQAPAQAQE